MNPSSRIRAVLTAAVVAWPLAILAGCGDGDAHDVSKMHPGTGLGADVDDLGQNGSGITSTGEPNADHPSEATGEGTR